ncbi:hypothetical protein K1J50_13810, partial [Caldovatus sp. SYSU G05006]|nr:hypothetical protein [Caldovatus aquaticus]MBW8268912.1 hypothetical protein [Caldovatus aquaticus]MBW8269781.1 hypothetical protein [Caldovatus aquaticus]MBW8270556.1 hypothetical protein [Caldovatus aquaticus]
MKAHRSAAGAKGGEGDASHQAIGRSRGGRPARGHALCDEQGRPHAILPTGGNGAAVTAAATPVSAVAPPRELVADKGCDANRRRRRGHPRHLVAQGCLPARRRTLQAP